MTLTGPGGVGKTRLAVEAAAEIAEHFADGVHFVALAPIADPALVLPAVADAVGLDKAGAPDVGELLEHSLAERRLLLVVDNFEHLLDAAPSVSRLLAKTRNVRVLATSSRAAPRRGRAGVSGAAARALGRNGPLRRAGSVAPAQLRAHGDEFGCDRRDLPPLGGLPLAIELAAARIPLSRRSCCSTGSTSD